MRRGVRCGRPRTRALAAVALVVAGVVLTVGEAVNRGAARRDLGSRGEAGRTVVVVLGFRNVGPRVNGVNRWRSRAGVATAEVLDADLVVFSGGAPGGAVEADLLAEEAYRLGLRRPIVRERESRTTHENLRLALPYLDDATRIALVSHPLHAQRARRYLAHIRPDLADRLVPPVVRREGWWILLLPVAGAYEVAVRSLLWSRSPSRRRGTPGVPRSDEVHTREPPAASGR